MPTFTLRLALALSLSLGTLAACTPAPFQPGTTTVAQPQAEMPLVALQGSTRFQGGPVTDATIELEEYFTGRPVPTFAAGQTPPAGLVSVERESLKTDAEGRFSVKVAGLAEGTMLYLAVKKEGVLLANVYTRSRQAAAGYRTLQTERTAQEKFDALVEAGIFKGLSDGGLEQDTHMSRSTIATILSKLMVDPFSDNSSSSFDDTGAGYIESVQMNMLNGFADTFNQPSQQDQISAEQMDRILQIALRQAPSGDNLAQGLSSDPGVSDWAKGYVAAAVEAGVTITLESGNDSYNQTLLTGLQNLSSTGFENVVQLEGNTIRIGDRTFDATVPVGTTGETPPPAPAPTTSPLPVQAGVETIGASSDFSPTVTLSNVANVSKVTFTQPEGTIDVESIYTRFKKSDLKAEGGVGTYSDIAWSGFVADGTLTGGHFSGALAVPAASTEQAPAVTLPSRFGSLELTSADSLYSAPLTLNGNINVARFSIYHRGDYVYMVIKYLLTDSIRINSGHTTNLDTSVVWLAPGASAESVLRSRRGHTFEGFQKVS